MNFWQDEEWAPLCKSWSDLMVPFPTTPYIFLPILQYLSLSWWFPWKEWIRCFLVIIFYYKFMMCICFIDSFSAFISAPSRMQRKNQSIKNGTILRHLINFRWKIQLSMKASVPVFWPTCSIPLNTLFIKSIYSQFLCVWIKKRKCSY